MSLFRKLTASLALAALIATAVPATGLAASKGRSAEAHKRISQKFEDMAGFEWGLNHVVKMQVKGFLKGRDHNIFAPGAKITHQEAAVAVVRLMEKEAEAAALPAAEVDALLASMPDRAAIAGWARNSVAMLAKANAVDKAKAFSPSEDATRLYVAVLLVKALGHEAEAQSKMQAALSFKDAHRIPADYVGYVAAAVDHKLITGYNDRTFRPDTAVKRIEMAVMMGRADGLFQREKADEIKGSVKSVDAANSKITVTSRGRDLTLSMADDAAIFVDTQAAELDKVLPGMKVEIKLNADGKVIFLEAATRVAEPAPAPATATGTISAMTAATGTATAKISLSVTTGTTTTVTEYSLDAAAVIKINGVDDQFAGLAVGDTATLTITGGKVTQIDVTRPVQVSGTISALAPSSQNGPASITLSVTANNTTATTSYTLSTTAALTINGAAAQFSDLMVGDTAALTLVGASANAVAVTRTVVQGALVQLMPATDTQPNRVAVGSNVNGTFTTQVYDLPAGVQITLNGAASQFSALQVADSVKLTYVGATLLKLEATR